MTMLNFSSSEEDKDVASLLAQAAVLPSMMNFAQEAVEDALPKVMLVVHATVILRLMVSDTIILVRTITVKMLTLRIMLDFQALKSMEEALEVNASKVLLVALAPQLQAPASASSIHAQDLDQAPNSQSMLVQDQPSAREKERCQLADIEAQLIALIL